jgi:kynurenine formamidase
MHMPTSPPDATEPTEDEVLEYIRTLSNGGRWGSDDVLGALNFLTPEKVKAAAGLVDEGSIVSCSRIVEWAPKPPLHEAAVPPIHFMQKAGEGSDHSGGGSAYDWMGVPLHGLHITHLDAMSHIFWNGKMHNGMDAQKVRMDRGATAGGIDDVASRGIVTRGVLLDIPRARGVDWLAGNEGVAAADLVAAERLAGVEVESGDFLLVRTGYGAHRKADLGVGSTPSGGHYTVGMPGLLASCLPWLHERSVAVLATDTGSDVMPSTYSFTPVHTVAMVAMGVWILDACDLEHLGEVCEAKGRRHFMITCSPLRLKNATGSPVNPLAVF